MTQDLDRAPVPRGDRVEPRDPGRRSRHGSVAQLLIAWSPLSLILVAYAAATWISAPLGAGDGSATNRLGFGVHVTGPAAADQHTFGVVPSVWVQQRLVDGSAHWYDAVAALVYVTHFVAIPLVTAVLWFCVRDRFARWIGAVLVFTTIGTTVYVVCPAAPPWLASQQGAIGRVDRISNLGWELLHLDWIGVLSASGQGGSNPVAAMPSLHAGATVLIALFLWPTVSAGFRAALVAYVLVMAVVLVYTGEHYVVDVVAGWLTAVTAVWLAAVVGPKANPR